MKGTKAHTLGQFKRPGKPNKQTNKLRDIEFYNKQAERKQELIEQEQQLSVEYGKQEQVQHLLDEFTRTKVNLLTDTINDKGLN